MAEGRRWKLITRDEALSVFSVSWNPRVEPNCKEATEHESEGIRFIKADRVTLVMENRRPSTVWNFPMCINAMSEIGVLRYLFALSRYNFKALHIQY